MVYDVDADEFLDRLVMSGKPAFKKESKQAIQ